MNIFSWSLPFVAEKITEIFVHIMSKKDIIEDDEENIDVGKLINK
jgi:hypothetical protein